MNAELSKIVVPTALRESFTAGMIKCRVIYFCGPCGIGKTSVAYELLNGRTVREYKVTTRPVTLNVKQVCAAKIGDNEYSSFNAAVESDEVTGTFCLESGSIVNASGTAVHFVYDAAANITVSDGSITAQWSALVLEPSDAAKLTITAGIFTAGDTALNTGVETTLTGGTFIKNDDYSTAIINSTDGSSASDLLADGYCYYVGENTNSGTVLSETGE